MRIGAILLEAMFNSVARYIRLSSRLYLRGAAPTIVYSKERTGSVALYQSLAAAGHAVIATHYLDPAKIGEGKLSGSARWASKHVVQPRRKAKFITLVRNPVENILSTFARGVFVDKALPDGTPIKSPLEQSIDQLIALFQDEYLGSGAYLRELDWFETEYQRALGIDVFSSPFDKSIGYGRVAHDTFEGLILRTELADDAKAKVVAEFLGIAPFSMLSRGEATQGKAAGAPGMSGDNSPYRDHYRELKRRATIPEGQWNSIVQSKLATHFFDADELIKARSEQSSRIGTS